jgi:hypothetical protein
MKSLLRVFAAVAIALVCAPAISRGSIVAVGDAVPIPDWSQGFEVKESGGFNQMGVMWDTGAGFLTPAFSGMSAGWTTMNSSFAGIAFKAGSDTDLFFTLNFVGDTPSPLSFDFYAYKDTTKLDYATAVWNGTSWAITNAPSLGLAPAWPTIVMVVNDEVVPEPATIVIWSLLGAGSWLGMRVWRRRGSRFGDELAGPVRQSWSPEARQAIHEIIARGNRPRS